MAFLLALALVVSVMSGLGLSVSAEQESNTPGTEEVQQQDKTEAGAAPSEVKAEEEAAKPEGKPVQEETKDEQKTEAKENADKPAEKQEKATPKAGENIQTATIGTGDKTVTVKTTAAAGVLPEGAKLVVKKLADKDQAYQDAESTLKDSQVTYDDFLALDVGFEVNGKEVEPEAGSVQVQFELGAGLLPETADTSTLAVQHLTDGKAETVADAGAVTAGDVTVKNETIKADFEVKSFSTFTITWNEYCTITAHYVDESDKEINPSTVNQVISSNSSNFTKTVTFASDKNYALTFNGYNYKEAYIIVDGVKKTVTRMEISASGVLWSRTRTVTFYNGNVEVTKHTYNNSTIEDNLYLVYAADATIGGPGGSITDQKKLGHDKYVEAKDDGTYDLSLTVSGAKGSKTDKAKLDILLIVDRSGSMARKLENEYQGDSYYKTRRIDKVADAVNSLTSALDTKKETLDVKYSVITFAGDKGTNAARKDIDWTDSASNVNTTIGNINPDGGTNYQAGIRMAKTQLNQARPDAQKVVIFLTDGRPTYYIGGGTGYDDSYNDLEACAENAKKEISNMWTDYFYCVGAGPAFKDDNTTNKTAYQNLVGLKDSVHATNKGVYRATSTAELNKIFTDMSANITNLYCDHVTVTDELSDNVELVESASGTPKNLIVTVKKGDKDGVVMVSEEKKVTFQDAKIWAEYKDGKITLNFPKEYTLDPEYTYIVTANIKATEEAYQRVRENGGQYPNKGEKGTGKTSEGEWGVFTNTKAEVDYTYNGVGTTEGYNNPVIKLKPAKLIVKKTITGLTEEQIEAALKNKLTFNITYTYPNQTTGTAQIKLDKVTAGENGEYTFTYTSGDIWSMGATYEVTETDYKVTDYDCNATPTDAKGSIPKYSTATASFTNTYTKATQDLTITKAVSGEDKAFDLNVSGIDYTFTITPGESVTVKDGTYGAATFSKNVGTVTIKGENSVTIPGLPVGTYTVRENSGSDVPEGYDFDTNSTEMSGTATLTNKDAGSVTITNKYKIKTFNVTVKKEVTGNMSDPKDELSSR